MADNETIADIIAEMRNDASEDEYTPDGILGQTLNSYADRLEAAHRRELSKNVSKNGADFGQLGDAAKLRNALKQVNELNDLWFDTFALPDGATSIHDEIENVISAALAATAEKSSAVDDCTKLREALKAIVGLCAGLMPTWDGAVGRIKDMAEAALAAPARNCDVGTAQEQDERFHRFCAKHHTGSCAGCHNPVGDYTVANGVRECALVWAQMPYEEGGAK